MQTKFIIFGRVQGVWFRASVKEVADKLKVKGYAKNLDSGRVEVVASGSIEQIEKLRAYCIRGPELSRVDKIEAEEMAEESFGDFSIL